jgi:Reverse transcriptase (RNA-dependent DNA polymerase)
VTTVDREVVQPSGAGRFSHSQSSQLYADALSEDLQGQGQGLVLNSQAGVRQGDPCGPLFFALALQPVLETTLAAEADADLLAYADDVTLQALQTQSRRHLP